MKFRKLKQLAYSVVALGALAITPGSASAQHFEGETITLLVATGPSSGATAVARIVAENLSEQLEGNPTIVVKNLPGGGGARALNFLTKKAPKDGTTLYYGFWSGVAQILEAPGFNFKYEDFTALGGLKQAGTLAWGNKNMIPGGLKDAADITKADPLTIGGVSILSGRTMLNALAYEVLGVNYKLVAGYKGTGEVRTAIASGEIMSTADAIHVYLPTVAPLLNGAEFPLYHMPQINADGNAVDNPVIAEYAPSFFALHQKLKGGAPSGVAWDTFKQTLLMQEAMQHVLIGPPGMKDDAAAELEAGLKAAMASEAFGKSMKTQLLFVPQHVDRETALKILQVPSQTKPEIARFYGEMVAKNSH